jgi:hypothetical protein
MNKGILLLVVGLFPLTGSSSKDWRDKDVLEYTDRDFDSLGIVAIVGVNYDIISDGVNYVIYHQKR